jgi:hypothetical protein
MRPTRLALLASLAVVTLTGPAHAGITAVFGGLKPAPTAPTPAAESAPATVRPAAPR